MCVHGRCRPECSFLGFLHVTVWCCVRPAGVRGAPGADGVWGEHSDEPLQPDADSHRRVRRAPSLRGVAHAGRRRHQQTGASVEPVRLSCDQQVFHPHPLFSGLRRWGSHSQGGSLRKLGVCSGPVDSRSRTTVSNRGQQFLEDLGLTGGWFQIWRPT